MSSSTETIVTKNSTMNNNDRKRPLSSSASISSSPSSAKRRDLSSSSSVPRRTAHNDFDLSKQNHQRIQNVMDNNEQQYIYLENQTSLTESTRLTSGTILNHSIHGKDVKNEFSTSKTTQFICKSSSLLVQHKRDASLNEHVSTKRSPKNMIQHPQKHSETQQEPMYTRKHHPLSFVVKSPATLQEQRNSMSQDDSGDETERLKPNSSVIMNTPGSLVSSGVMGIVTAADLSKKSMRTENNVIIQQLDGNVNNNNSTRVVKLVVPTSNSSPSLSTVNSPSIKMLSSGDGLASALRVPTKIQLTKTSYTTGINSQKSVSLISSISHHSVHQEQSLLSPTSTVLLDIPIETAEKQQQSIVDYHTTTALPPTPPPPVLDQPNSETTNKLFRRFNETHQKHQEQEREKQIRSLISIQSVQDSDRSRPGKHANRSSKTKRTALDNDSSSTGSDWSVPPTSELSPTSITSSSPDLSQNPVHSDDLSVDIDSTHIPKSSLTSNVYQNRSLSSSCPTIPLNNMCFSESNGSLPKSLKSKSLTRLSTMPIAKSSSINEEKPENTTKDKKLSSSPRLRRRRGDHEKILVRHHNESMSKTDIEQTSTSIIRDLLCQMIEQVESLESTENLKNPWFLNSVPSMMAHSKSFEPISHRQPVVHIQSETVKPTTKPTKSRKRVARSRSILTRAQEEFCSTPFQIEDLDDKSYLLYVNEHRSEFERIDSPISVEQRMRNRWAQMNSQEKQLYYKRVIDIYRKPYRQWNAVPAFPSRDSDSFPTKVELEKSNTETPVTMDCSSYGQLERQISTPLSFHSIPSSIGDEQYSGSSSDLTSKSTIFLDVANELIKGGNGLDRLSCTAANFSNHIQQFLELSLEKRMKMVNQLEEIAGKTSANQLQRASIFWTEKVKYFAAKYSIHESDSSMNELSLIVKYFYLYVLSLMIQKQHAKKKELFNSLINGELSFDDSFVSNTLSFAIEYLILGSSFANDYLGSQPLTINQIDYALPLVRNSEFEHDLLDKIDSNAMKNPFSTPSELAEYLSQCEHPPRTANIPYYQNQPVQPPAMFFQAHHPHPSHYYYHSAPSSSDMNNYYFNVPAPYAHPSQHYSYNSSANYYHPATSSPYPNNEQYQVYSYPQQTLSSGYPSTSNSNNSIDIPSHRAASQQRSHRPISTEMARNYTKSQNAMASDLPPSTPGTPAVYDPAAAISPQSSSANSADVQSKTLNQ